MSETPIDELSQAVLDVTSRDIDWQEARGENMDGWTFWEAFDQEVTLDDGTEVTLVLISPDGAEADIAFTEDGTRIDLNDPQDYWEIPRDCKHCGMEVTSTDGDTWVDETDGDGCSGNPEADDVVSPDLVHEVEGVLTSSDLSSLDRAAHGYAEGPMMNYWYPLETSDRDSIGSWRKSFDVNEAAFRLRHHSLCLVEVDGELGLALTGGGMDFTWDIVGAFIDLDYLPPVHFCDLPGMSGRGPDKRDADGWRVDTVGTDDDATRYVVTAPDGTATPYDTWYHARDAVPQVPVPATERDQRIIDAVTEALTVRIRMAEYRKKRHLEQYGPQEG